MSGIGYAQLTSLPDGLAELEAESCAEGFSMVRRLREAWLDGTNRFDREGLILLGTFRDGRLIATAGLNLDPYLSDVSMGRLRHVYVLQRERRHGIGRALVERLLVRATGRFRTVRLSTGQAPHFYESLGFEPIEGPHLTHAMAMRDPDAARAELSL